MADIAYLSNILYPEEKKLIMDHLRIIDDVAIVNLTVHQLILMFKFIDLQVCKNGILPSGHIVSMVWEELANRAIQDSYDIRP